MTELVKKLARLQSPEQRARYAARASRFLAAPFRATTQTSPVFVAGKQRSGTSMLMNVFQLHPQVHVFDEKKESAVFRNGQLRSFDCVTETLGKSKYQFNAYKIISDSHRLRLTLDEFAAARCIWMYRNYLSVAESSIKKFRDATRAVRLVCENKPGGGWFADGVSAEVAAILQRLDRSEFVELDYACLAWWARNLLFLEQELVTYPRVRLTRYESLVEDPLAQTRKMFDWLGMERCDRAARFIRASSTKRAKSVCHPSVEALCSQLLEDLDQLYFAQWE